MSQRGSFVTEYIYCPKCFEAAKRVLLHRDKGCCSVVIPHWPHANLPEGGAELPIIAGKLGATCRESMEFEIDFGDDLDAALCHKLRIAVLNEDGPDESELAVTIVFGPGAERNFA